MTKVECQAIALSARICSSPISILLLLEISTILRTFFGSAVSSAGFIICLLGISKLHHCKKYIYFIRNVMLSRKKNECLNQKLDIQHSSLLLFKPHRFLGISQNALFLRISQNALSFRNVLGRTILQECPRTHYYFDEIYEAHESSFVCIKPLNK